MWFNFRSISGNDSISQGLGSTVELVVSLMLRLHTLIFLVFSSFTLLSVLFIQAESRLLLLSRWSHAILVLVLVCKIQLLFKALLHLLDFILVIVWRHFSEWRSSIIVTITIFKSIVGCSSFSVFIAFVRSSEVISILRVVLFNTSFTVTLLSVLRFPQVVGSHSSRPLSKVVSCSLVVLSILLLISFVLLWNACVLESWSLVVAAYTVLLRSWSSLVALTGVSELLFQSESSQEIRGILNLLKFCNIFILFSKLLIVALLQEIINS